MVATQKAPRRCFLLLQEPQEALQRSWTLQLLRPCTKGRSWRHRTLLQPSQMLNSCMWLHRTLLGAISAAPGATGGFCSTPRRCKLLLLAPKNAPEVTKPFNSAPIRSNFCLWHHSTRLDARILPLAPQKALALYLLLEQLLQRYQMLQLLLLAPQNALFNAPRRCNCSL